MIEEDLAAVLSPIVPGEVYPNAAPQGAGDPRITYFVVSGVPLNDLSGTANLRNSRMQIDVWSSSYVTVKTKAKEVSEAMESAAFTNIPLSDQDLYEADVKLHRVSMDYSIWHE